MFSLTLQNLSPRYQSLCRGRVHVEDSRQLGQGGAFRPEGYCIRDERGPYDLAHLHRWAKI